MTKLHIALLATCTLLTTSAFADVIVNPAFYSGSRTTGPENGIVGSGDWDGLAAVSFASGRNTTTGSGKPTKKTKPDNGFQIAWQVEDLGTYFDYQYTFSGIDGGALTKALSHFIIQVTRDTFGTLNGFTLPNGGAGYVVSAPGDFGPGGSNPGISGSLYGVKIDIPNDDEDTLVDESEVTTLQFSFSSRNTPVWGDFYAKSGKSGDGTYAYNTGFGVDPGCVGAGSNTCGAALNGLFSQEKLEDYSAWIVRPNGPKGPNRPNDVVPEPGFYGMVGLTFSGVFLAFSRRRVNA